MLPQVPFPPWQCNLTTGRVASKWLPYVDVSLQHKRVPTTDNVTIALTTLENMETLDRNFSYFVTRTPSSRELCHSALHTQFEPNVTKETIKLQPNHDLIMTLSKGFTFVAPFQHALHLFAR